MKTSKLFTLDIEIVDELKKLPNASKLINNMLKDYFNQHGALKKQELINKLNLKELKSKEIIGEMKIIKERIKEIEITEKRTKSIFKNIPTEIINDFKAFPTMSENILYLRFKDIYSKTYDLNYKELKKAYDDYYQKEEDDNNTKK